MDNNCQKLNFTAIDFETAVGKRNSICQVGIAIVKNGEIVKTISRLVQPPYNEYSHWNIQVHGITPDQTKFSPLFPDIWEEIRPYVEGQKLIAHNAAFDTDCLRKTLDYYNLPIPEYTSECTYKLTKMKLNVACQAYKIDFSNHHDAEADAVGCAKLYLKIKQDNCPDFALVDQKPKRKAQKLSGDILKQDLSEADPFTPFYNRKVVITGVFDSMERIELAEKLKKKGAKINTSISSKTDYLIKGNNPGYMKVKKAQDFKARSYPIQIIGEIQLLQLLKN